MKKQIKILWLFVYCLLLTAYSYGQENNHVFVERASTTYLKWDHSGDYTSYDSLYFVVKPCTSNTCVRLIQKKLTTSYTEPYTTSTCTLYVDETSSFNAAKYYYSIYAYGVDTVFITSGNFNLMLNGQTPTDGVASLTPYYTVALDTPNVANTFIVGQDSNNTWYRKTVAQTRTILGIDTITNAVNLPDSVVFDSQIADMVTKSTQQNITGQKNFMGGAEFGSDTTIRIDNDQIAWSDSNYYPIVFNGLTGYGDWGFGLRNFYINQISQTNRPDQCMFLGYNWSYGGGRIKPNDNAMGLVWESAYEGSMEFWFGFYGKTQYRPFFFTMDSINNKINGFFQYDAGYLKTRYGNTIYQLVDSTHLTWEVPILTSFNINNYSPFRQLNSSGNTYLTFPCFDNLNRYTLANATTFTSPNLLLKLDTMYLRLTNMYGIQSYDGDGSVANILYYDTDKLRIKATTGDPIYFTGSHLFYEDTNGVLSDIVNPVYPFDTTGVDIGEKYVDPLTGNVKVVMGTDIVVNGDFTDWTGGGKTANPDSWVISWEDTTKNYIEQSPTGVLHYVFEDSTHQDTTLTIYQTGVSIGGSYGYSFRVDSVDGLFNILIGGKQWNANGVVSAGYFSGTVDSATSTRLFSMVKQPFDYDTADIYIDDIRVWDLNGAKQAPTEYKQEFHPFLNMAVDDTIPINYYDKATTIDSIRYDVDDSVTVQITHGAGGTEDTLFVSDTVLTGRGTISTFDDATITAGSEVQLYITAIGDNTIKWWIKIYRRE